MTIVEVYNKPEKFKYGWIAGFYDALPDDGLRYLDDIIRYGPRNGEDETFMAGYLSGRLSRLGQGTCRPVPVKAHFKSAA